MSDSVGYPVGNTNGRDHIPWATITLANLALLGYTRTTGISLAAIMALCWRVKKWSVASASAGVSGTASSNPGPLVETVTSSFTIPAFDMPMYNSAAVIARREREIAGGYSLSENGFRGLRNGGFNGSVNQNVSETTTYDSSSPEHQEGTFSQGLVTNAILFADSGDYELVGFDSNLFYPKIDIGARLNGQYCTVLIGVQSAGSNGTLTVSPGIVPSFTFPLKISMSRIIGAHGNVPATTTSGSAALEMTAVEFWPYRNKAGTAPIWNSGSGAQVNDPFS